MSGGELRVPAPLEPDVRAAILEDIHDGLLSRAAIARKHKVAGSTVTKIAKDEGVTTAFDRSKTVHATRARKVDITDLRSRLALRNYLRAHAIHDRLDEDEYQWQHVTNEGLTVTVRAAHPPAQDERNLASAISSYTTAADKLTDQDDGAEQAKSMIRGIGDGLQLLHEMQKAQKSGT